MLRPDHVWRQGDQRRYACVESKHPTSGLVIDLGDGRTVHYLEQEEIAIAYLKAHRDGLRALAEFPGVKTFEAPVCLRARPVMEAMIHKATGVKVMSLHHDISIVTGEEVLLFALAETPEFRDLKKK